MTGPPLRTENPHRVANPGAGKSLSEPQYGELIPSPTWREHSASVGRVQLGSPRADGGPYGCAPTETN